MSCPSQESLSVYADGELSLLDGRDVESHLVQCRRCRGTVLALRDEATLLTDLIRSRNAQPTRAVAPEARARGLAVGMAPALGIAALVATVGGWLLETTLPAGTSWLNPLRLMGVYDMLFDTIFMLRDRAPGLLEGAIAIGALFSVASILTFLAGSLGKRLAGPGVVLLATVGLGGGVPTSSEAFELRTHEKSFIVGAGEVLPHTLVISAETVRIDGEVQGDLYALAEQITITGTVDGNVFVVGDDVEITGEVDDSLYIGAERVRIEGKADDLYAFSEDFHVHERGVVERDFAIFGDRVRVDGQIGRDFDFYGKALELRGAIGRNLVTRGRTVTLLDGTTVEGDFHSYMHEGEVADVAPGVMIGGERHDEVIEHGHARTSRWADPGFYMMHLVIMISAFLVGMVLHTLRPGLFETALPDAGDFFRELGLGFVTVVVMPILIVICFATVVGIPIGLIGLFLLVTALFLSLILIAALIGSALVGSGETGQRFGLALLAGLVIVTIAVNLPFVGGLIWIVAIMTGVGMLVAHVRDSYRLWTA